MRKVVRGTIAAAEIAGALVGYALLYSTCGRAWQHREPRLVSLLQLHRAYPGRRSIPLADEPKGIGLSFLVLLPQVFASQNPAWGYSLQAGPQVLLLLRPNTATAWFGFQRSIETAPVALDKSYFALNVWPMSRWWPWSGSGARRHTPYRRLRRRPAHNARPNQRLLLAAPPTGPLITERSPRRRSRSAVR